MRAPPRNGPRAVAEAASQARSAAREEAAPDGPEVAARRGLRVRDRACRSGWGASVDGAVRVWGQSCWGPPRGVLARPALARLGVSPLHGGRRAAPVPRAAFGTAGLEGGGMAVGGGGAPGTTDRLDMPRDWRKVWWARRRGEWRSRAGEVCRACVQVRPGCRAGRPPPRGDQRPPPEPGFDLRKPEADPSCQARLRGEDGMGWPNALTFDGPALHSRGRGRRHRFGEAPQRHVQRHRGVCRECHGVVPAALSLSAGRCCTGALSARSGS